MCSKDDESNQFFSTDDSENYDLRLPASTATSTTRRYVMDHGGTSHALIILRIDKWSSGNGIVTYIDPYHIILGEERAIESIVCILIC